MVQVSITGKKGAERLKEQEESAPHQAVCAPIERGKTSVIASIRSFQLEKQELRRQGLISHLQTLQTLLRQGIAVRGDTDLESNIYNLT